MKQPSGFAVVPAEVLATGNGHAIAVYAAIAQHANAKGVAWPSVKRLAEITGWSRPTVDKAITVLINSGVLTKKHRHENGAQLSNQYHLPHHPQPANVQGESRLRTPESTLRGVRSEVSGGTQPGFHEQEPENKNHKEPDGSLEVVRGGKPAVQGDTPAHRLVNAWYSIVGGHPTNHGRDLGNAKTLLRAGLSQSDLGEFIPWLRSVWFAKDGIDLSIAVRGVNQWQSVKSAPAPKKRLVV